MKEDEDEGDWRVYLSPGMPIYCQDEQKCLFVVKMRIAANNNFMIRSSFTKLGEEENLGNMIQQNTVQFKSYLIQ